jgi:hypothetical protein
VDFVTKFEKALRTRYHHLKELAKIEHLIDAFEKGAKRGAKRTGRSKLSAAGRTQTNLDGAEGPVGESKEGISVETPGAGLYSVLYLCVYLAGEPPTH